MTSRTAFGLGACALMLGGGIILGALGTIPPLFATALAALGFSLGSTLATLCIVDAVRRARRSIPINTSADDVAPIIGHAAVLADDCRRRGYLALAGASEGFPGLAGRLFREGSELVIKGESPETIRAALGETTDAWILGTSKRRALLAVSVAAASVAALFIAFVILINSMGLALDPSRMAFAPTLGLMLCVYAAFGLAVIAPTMVDRLSAANVRESVSAMLATEALVSIRDGSDGPAIRTFLEQVLSRETLPARPDRAHDAIAA